MSRIAAVAAVLVRLRRPAAVLVVAALGDVRQVVMLVLYAALVVGTFAVLGLAVRVFLLASGLE